MVVASLTSVVSVAVTPTAPVPSKGLLMLIDPARTTAAATPTRITPVIAAMAIPATQLLWSRGCAPEAAGETRDGASAGVLGSWGIASDVSARTCPQFGHSGDADETRSSHSGTVLQCQPATSSTGHDSSDPPTWL